MNERRFLTTEELQKKVPAAFSTNAHPDTSNRYTFVPTYKIIDHFAQFGWKPVFANQVKSKKSNKYGKHTIRFAKKEGRLEVDEYIEEIVYHGSHDRTFPVQMNMGLYRCFCENQCVTVDSEFMSFNHKHINFTFEEIENLVKVAIKQFSKLSRKVELYKTIELTEVEQNKFAYIAKNAHWGEESQVNPELLLEARRPQDEGNDLWHVFNRIQESITKGGLKYQAVSEKTGKVRNRSTRQIKNIVRDLNINKELWTIMQAFATNRNFS
jgi:hypothetical protein